MSRALVVAGLLVLGVLAIVAGGADDSPGLQGIGLVLVVATLAVAVGRSRRGR